MDETPTTAEPNDTARGSTAWSTRPSTADDEVPRSLIGRATGRTANGTTWRSACRTATIGLCAGTRLDAAGQLGHLVVDAHPLGHLRPDLAVGVHDGGVVAAAEGLPDLR